MTNMDPNELFGNLGDDEIEDRTIYSRRTPYGRRQDFTQSEKTRFKNGLPQTIKEHRSGKALPCGHHVTKDNPFGGYCALCGEEYCSRCTRMCPRCGKSVSANCCARRFDGEFYCFSCRRVLMFRKVVRVCFSIIGAPFLSEPVRD